MVKGLQATACCYCSSEGGSCPREPPLATPRGLAAAVSAAPCCAGRQAGGAERSAVSRCLGHKVGHNRHNVKHRGHFRSISETLFRWHCPCADSEWNVTGSMAIFSPLGLVSNAEEDARLLGANLGFVWPLVAEPGVADAHRRRTQAWWTTDRPPVRARVVGGAERGRRRRAPRKTWLMYAAHAGR